MAKYDRKAARTIGKAMDEFKQGELTSGVSGKLVKSRKQAIAIGLAQAREARTMLPPKRRAGA